jgi:hypothetical protein
MIVLDRLVERWRALIPSAFLFFRPRRSRRRRRRRRRSSFPRATMMGYQHQNYPITNTRNTRIPTPELPKYQHQNYPNTKIPKYQHENYPNSNIRTTQTSDREVYSPMEPSSSYLLKLSKEVDLPDRVETPREGDTDRAGLSPYRVG